MFNHCPAPVRRFNRISRPVVAATLATVLLPGCTYPRNDGDHGRPTAPASASTPACSDLQKSLNGFVYPVHLQRPYAPVDATARENAVKSAASLYKSRNQASVSVDIEVENVDRDDAAGQAAMQAAVVALQSELRGGYGITDPDVTAGVVTLRTDQHHPPVDHNTGDIVLDVSGNECVKA